MNGNVIGTLRDGVLYGPDGNIIGRWSPESGATGFVSGRNLLEGTGLGAGGLNLGGRRIAIGDKEFMVLPDNSIINPMTGAVVGQLKNGVPYSLSNNLLADELRAGSDQKFTGQEILQFSPEQAAQMRNLLAKRREGMKQGIGSKLSKITPDGRVLARAKKKQAKDFGSKTVSSWPVDMSRMILKDKAIPAVLQRSIDSRYMSVPASAIVERHVYAEDGRNIIIPAGSKLIGSVTGSPGTNHVAKLEISWERLIRPDGGSFTLQAISGDAQGRGGVAAYLDEMFLARYGKPILQSTMVSAISYLVASDEPVTENQNYGTSSQSDRAQAAQEARENFIDDMEMIFNQLIEESSSTPPVVFVPAGTRMTIFAMEDLWLRTEEDDVDDYEAEMGADTTEARTPGQQYGMAKRPVGGSMGGAASTADISSPDQSTFAPADEVYYDPGYTGEGETQEEIGTNQADETQTLYQPTPTSSQSVSSGGRPSTLEELYNSQQGLSSYPSSEQAERISTPLQQQQQVTTPGGGSSSSSLELF